LPLQKASKKRQYIPLLRTCALANLTIEDRQSAARRTNQRKFCGGKAQLHPAPKVQNLSLMSFETLYSSKSEYET
jgi:hypothetical protein